MRAAEIAGGEFATEHRAVAGVVARMQRGRDHFLAHGMCQRCARQPSAIVRSVSGTLQAVCRSCSATPSARAAAPGASSARHYAPGLLGVLERELELLELEASVPPPAPRVKRYTPGPLGVLERELDLLERDL